MTQNKKNIVFITTSYPRFDGDLAGCFFIPLLEELKKDFNFKIVTPDSDISVIDSDEVLRFKYFWPVEFQKLAYNQGIPENISRNPFLLVQLPFLLLAMFRTSLKHVYNSDVIISNWLLPCGLIGALISKMTRKPHIAVEHSAGIHYLSVIPAGKYILRSILKSTDKLVFVSRSLYEKSKNIVNIDNANHEIIPMGINTEDFDIEDTSLYIKNKYDIPDNHSIVFFIGRMVEIKGLDILINALHGVENITLIAAGDGENKKSYQDLAEKLNVNTIFTGTVRGKDKINLFKACDLIVFPSRILKGGRSEGTPVSIIEAMASEKVIFAANTGGIPFIIEDNVNGKLFNPDNVKELNIMIVDFLANKDFYYKLSKEAKNCAKSFDIQIISGQYKAIIDEVSKNEKP